MMTSEQEAITDAIIRIQKIPDPVQRATEVAGLIKLFSAGLKTVRRLRHATIIDMLDSGVTSADVARLCGVSISTIKLARTIHETGRNHEPA